MKATKETKQQEVNRLQIEHDIYFSLVILPQIHINPNITKTDDVYLKQWAKIEGLIKQGFYPER